MKAPIFIIGNPRSGTSIVYKAITKSLQWSGYGESHVMPCLQDIIYSIELKRDFQQSLSQSGQETILAKINLDRMAALNIDYIRESYLNIFDGSTHFVDKTPGAAAAHGWGIIKRCFPGAAILCCYRSPVEVIESSLKKFDHSSEAAEANGAAVKTIASGWASAMQGIDELMHSTFAKDAILIDQLQLRKNPAAELTKVFDFLGAPPEATQKAIKICEESREDVLTSAIELDSYKQLNSLGLDATVEASVRETCSEACRIFNIAL